MTKQALFLDFADAKQQILAHATAFPQIETLSTLDCLHRITAKPIISPINVPGFNNSAMDGYAIRLSDLSQQPVLPVAGKIFAGQSTLPDWPIGTCLRIMTGAPVPTEAEAVVMQEETEITDIGIRFTHPVKPKQNIRFLGEDAKQNAEIIPTGQKLTIPMLSSLATLGLTQVEVYKPLKVAIFSTGDELVSLGTELKSGQIYDSNRFTLLLLLKQLGCEVIDLGIIPDDEQKIKRAFLQAADLADLVITSGGVSVGDADYTKQVLNELGHINFWKIAMKPGKPFAFGHIHKTLFCGLPGNPVSAVVTFYQLVQPLILKMSGYTQSPSIQGLQAKTLVNLKKSPGRLDFQRGQLLVTQSGELTVTTTGQQGSHITQSLSLADCFIILEKERGNVTAGEWVTVELFNALLK
ncbi:molybdopterin molybdotransferase MoeA [Zophobihabitans entericus]|uniref:Molybdopterin molybdenumtransferase n=1 Tax=Zophobihabitans entericus TaxID=1635327 RepID=A0A6G9ICJ4_9GAMM|nr:molybdopterin molybdotransferase MoeA [Zophobihabitans entericus]QIQ21951.1 molybdopterin molybdotransferase MoeA [Zophobihabitans entericus]